MKIGIAVFSGTGNTAYVVELLGKELRSLGATVDIRQIASTNMDADTIDFDPSCYDLVGIGQKLSQMAEAGCSFLSQQQITTELIMPLQRNLLKSLQIKVTKLSTTFSISCPAIGL
jgi:flavodoxin